MVNNFMKQTPRQAAFIAVIRQTAPPETAPFLPVHNEDFSKCSQIISDTLAHRQAYQQQQRTLPLPSAMLPPM